MKWIFYFFISTAILFATCNQAVSKSFSGKIISTVRISQTSFNPSLNNDVTILYSLSQEAKVTINVYDPDWGLIRALADKTRLNSGQQYIVWDGRDDKGTIVPNESYFFTITAENDNGFTETYDPVVFSGGVSHDITSAEISLENQTLRYTMPEMGRVMIRVGVQGGPLMHTLVDWKPRVKGSITEYWNGRDANNLVDIAEYEKTKLLITYFTLPENSVIVYGNNSLTYRDYKKKSTNQTIKQDRGTLKEGISRHYRISRILDYAPSLEISFPNADLAGDGVPLVSEKTMVKVDLKEEDKEVFRNQQFEIAFFLDLNFYAEDEVGYTPFNWLWDLNGIEEGDHVLTVNISGFKDQIGVLSQRVRVIKR